ncbi:MAG: hypothetical protein U0L71_03600 [Eggerthellaceae bacterium]|nr:hypothetical protein [Eggerthellaceae bacterium]
MQKNAVQSHNIALTGTRFATAALLACSLAFAGLVPVAAQPARAFAETTEIDAQPDELQQRVERSAADYNSATQRVQELEEQIASNQEQIAQIESDLPQQQERAADAMREQYKLQREAPGIVETILGAGSFSDFLVTWDYFSHVQNSNYAEIDRLAQMKQELETTEQELSDARDEAVSQQQAAEQALAEAQAAREEAQRKAQEEAARQAAEAAASEQAAAEDPAASGDDAAADDDGSASEPEAPAEEEPAVQAPSSDGADWSSDKASFVAQWAGRIDAYLAGSPLAGQGTTFAEAAWDYGVDPRWSPAISYTESSKGLYCFNPHNAWGWGSSSWGSWEEAIRAHVQGLARGYGYTISVSAAQKYCPPNWEHWYNTTLAQMNMI